MKSYDITPVAKPRMTKRDKWKVRKPVAVYRAYCDELRLKGFTLPDHGYHIIFILPMPTSWSKKKRAAMDGNPHQQKPDKDNLEKAVMDAIFKDDSHIWDGRVTKVWGENGKILVTEAEIYK